MKCWCRVYECSRRPALHFPVTESVRYTPNRRQGYHGGLTPQECLAPIAVIAPSLAEIEAGRFKLQFHPTWC